jgi:hypothetical protein
MDPFDLVPGEVVILRADLRKEKWMRYRCVTCSLRCLATVYIAPLCIPVYALFGGSCRREEAESFELILTNQNIHFRQLLYSCGLCCQQSGTKIIPLEKIQDVAVVSDWIGDTCGVVDARGEVYQIHFQTAGMGIAMPELSVFCIENPREFKKKVLEAKNRVITDTNIAGQSKLLNVADGQNQEQLARVLQLLERQMTSSASPPAP